MNGASPPHMTTQRGCIFGYGDLGIPALRLNGQSFTTIIALPDYAPVPTPLTYVGWRYHMGDTARESLGGLLNIFVAHHDGSHTPLIDAGNWEGAGSATFDPPVLIEEGARIVLVFGGETKPQWGRAAFRWIKREVKASVAPDISFRWLVS